MKIICFNRAQTQTEPEFYLKSDSALLLNNRPYYKPDFTSDLRCRISFVVKISRLGKYIQPKFAHRYYNELALGVDIFANDILEKQKAKGLPWEKAMSLDNSLALSHFVQFEDLLTQQKNVKTDMFINSERTDSRCFENLNILIDESIAHVSRFMTLKIGDLLFIDLPEESFPLTINDHIEARLNNQTFIEMSIK